MCCLAVRPGERSRLGCSSRRLAEWFPPPACVSNGYGDAPGHLAGETRALPGPWRVMVAESLRAGYP
jgi:hypothetical protein